MTTVEPGLYTYCGGDKDRTEIRTVLQDITDEDSEEDINWCTQTGTRHVEYINHAGALQQGWMTVRFWRRVA